MKFSGIESTLGSLVVPVVPFKSPHLINIKSYKGLDLVEGTLDRGAGSLLLGAGILLLGPGIPLLAGRPDFGLAAGSAAVLAAGLASPRAGLGALFSRAPRTGRRRPPSPAFFRPVLFDNPDAVLGAALPPSLGLQAGLAFSLLVLGWAGLDRGAVVASPTFCGVLLALPLAGCWVRGQRGVVLHTELREADFWGVHLEERGARLGVEGPVRCGVIRPSYDCDFFGDPNRFIGVVLGLIGGARGLMGGPRGLMGLGLMGVRM